MTEPLAPANANPLAALPEKLSNYTRKVDTQREWGTTLPAKDRKQIHEAAQKFEAMYVSEMMNYMFSGTDLSDSEFGGGPGEKMYQPLLVNEYSKGLASSGQTGISPVLEREMLKMQELQRNPRLASPTSNLHSADKSNATPKPVEAHDEHALAVK